MRKSRQNQSGEQGVWKPFSDLWSVIVLMLLLILMLFLLHATFDDAEDPVEDTTEYYEPADDLHGVDDEGEEEDGGEEDNDYKYAHEHDHDHDFDYPEQIIAAGAGGGDGDDGTGEGPGGYEDEGIKSAVYVALIDAETERVIKEEGVVFELYSEDNALQVLNTYYPEKISFHNYETTEDGTFYLPEKLFQGWYYLHELTEPSGYDASENVAFNVDRLYDWPEPLIVKVPAYPSRNIIRVQMWDADTNLSITGGTFDVIAAEDIITTDGTLRYKKDEIVDTIECDEKGYGESIELYLGNYILREKDIPEYYASLDQTIDSEVRKKTEVEAELHETRSSRTTIELRVVDELYQERGLEGMQFEIRNKDGSQHFTAKTDENGRITLSELQKDTTYYLTQKSFPKDYRVTETEVSVPVDKRGRINGEPHADITISNRMIRSTFLLEEAITKAPLSERAFSLFDQIDAENPIELWTTTGTPYAINGLSPGTYYLVLGSDADRRYTVEIEDTAEIQAAVIRIMTAKSIALVVFAGLAATVALAVVVILSIRLVRRIRKKKEEKPSTNP